MSELAINIIIDRDTGVFVEIENDNGESIRIGNVSQDDLYTKIRVTMDDILDNKSIPQRNT